MSFTSDSGRSVYVIPHPVHAITSGDLDLDGDLDIVTAHSFSSASSWGGVNIMENNGNGFFIQGDTSYIYSNQTEVLLVNLHNDSTRSIIVKDYLESVNKLGN